MCGKVLAQRKITRYGSHVEEYERILNRATIGFRDPLLEVVSPD